MKLVFNRRIEFEKLTSPLGRDLFRLAYFRLANQQDAEDVVQDVYLRAFRSFDTFQPGTNIKGWMTKILLNVVNDTLRKKVQRLELLAEDEECDELDNLEDQAAISKNPEALLIEKEVCPRLQEVLQRLPTSLLHPLLLRELEDMTYTEIGSILDIPVGTVMSRLFRARKIVRERLTKQLGTGDKREVLDHEM